MKGRKPNAPNIVPLHGGAARSEIPDPPVDMSEDGAAVWRDLAPSLAAKGRLNVIYLPMFRIWCEAYSDFLKFSYDLHTHGDYFVNDKGRNGVQEKQRAPWKLRNDAITTMTRIGALFGLTPLDEQRLGSDGQKDLLALIREQLDG